MCYLHDLCCVFRPCRSDVAFGVRTVDAKIMYARAMSDLCGYVSESYCFFCSSASIEKACRLAVGLWLVVALVETRFELNSSSRALRSGNKADNGRRFLLELVILGEVVGLLTTSTATVADIFALWLANTRFRIAACARKLMFSPEDGTDVAFLSAWRPFPLHIAPVGFVLRGGL